MPFGRAPDACRGLVGRLRLSAIDDAQSTSGPRNRRPVRVRPAAGRPDEPAVEGVPVGLSLRLCVRATGGQSESVPPPGARTDPRPGGASVEPRLDCASGQQAASPSPVGRRAPRRTRGRGRFRSTWLGLASDPARPGYGWFDRLPPSRWSDSVAFCSVPANRWCRGRSR